VRKNPGVILILATLLLIKPLAAGAAILTISNWEASGSQMWRITFPGYANGPSGVPQTASGASELVYPQSGLYTTIDYEEQISPTQKINLEAGILGSMTPSTGSDSDWDYSQSKNFWYYGTFETRGSSTFLNVDIKHMLKNNTEFFYGYGYSNSQYNMTNGFYSVIDYNSVASSLPTLNSTYSLVYHGPHVGLAATKQLAPNLQLVGSVSYAPLTLVQGHGWWNLRSLDFEHLGAGQMLDGKIGLRYLIAGRQNNYLTVGYRYQHYNLYTGSENSSPDITWTKASKLQQGWYMGGNFEL
jgi:hypothetical protein